MQATFRGLLSVSRVSNSEKTLPRAQGPQMYDTKPGRMTPNLHLSPNSDLRSKPHSTDLRVQSLGTQFKTTEPIVHDSGSGSLPSNQLWARVRVGQVTLSIEPPGCNLGCTQQFGGRSGACLVQLHVSPKCPYPARDCAPSSGYWHTLFSTMARKAQARSLDGPVIVASWGRGWTWL